MTDYAANLTLRRDVLLLAGAALLPGVSLAILPQVASQSYFSTLRGQAGLAPLAAHLRESLEHSHQPPGLLASLQQWCAKAADTVQAVVGDQWETLSHTVPSLVEDDLLSGRTRDVVGLNMTATEVALLLTD